MLPPDLWSAFLWVPVCAFPISIATLAEHTSSKPSPKQTLMAVPVLVCIGTLYCMIAANTKLHYGPLRGRSGASWRSGNIQRSNPVLCSPL